jgi:hypothetical protein
MDMRFGTWNVRSLYKVGSLVTVTVQEVRWEGDGTKPAGEYTFFCGKENENRELGTGYLCVRESCQRLRGLSLLVIGCHT